MKTIVNKLRYVLVLGFVAIGMTVLAQSIANIEKMSVSTQMLLNEIENGVSLNEVPTLRGSGPSLTPKHPEKQYRTVARPVIIDGETYFSAFVRVNGDNDLNTLETLGVKIESKFDNGLLTAMIPVSKIHEVAALDGVKKISAAMLMQPKTDNARQTTNADDVLSYSNDAQAAGLPHGYDGSGVIVGVIDNGIDYNHIAFKDKNGNTRIKRIYNYTYTEDYYGNPTNISTTEWTGSGTMPTTDDNSSDHGTHTSAIAGGSSVVVNGNTVTVTDDHANATYGGMAPGADLYLAGVKGLDDTQIATAFQRMYNYANSVNKPLVVNNSWGSQIGPHDGTGDLADIIQNYFGDNHPNNICLFAAGNEAGTADPTQGGGYHISGNASSNNPLRSILRCDYYIDTDDGYYYSGIISNAWCRNTNVASMGCRIHVLDMSNGRILTTVNVNPTVDGATVTGLGTYYSGTLYAYKDYVDNDKTQILLYTSGLTTRSATSNYVSNYTLAVEFYPTNGTAMIDVWGGTYCYFSDFLTTNGYNWTDGSDDMSVGDEATYPSAISIGAYVSKNRFTNSQGSTMNTGSTLNDILSFSSYATAEESPTGLAYPWITAPGSIIVSAVNHNHTTSVDNYSYYGSNLRDQLVVNSTTNPYAAAQGTSMASPAATGIVALWLQAAQEVGQDMTTTDIKNLMAETAIHDQWTDGTHANRFGNGKINALAGIEYILAAHSQPKITASSTTVNFVGEPGSTYTESVVVRGFNLNGDITATLADGSGVISINPTNLGNGGELVITFTPTEEGKYTATVTLSSNGVEPITITIHATVSVHIGSLTANEVVVPVYKSDLQMGGNVYQFTEDQVILDFDKHLEYADGGSDVEILVKSDEPITGYDLKNRDGEDGTWTLVGNVAHQGNSYVFGDKTMTFLDGETEMWFPMDDNTVNTGALTYYVPVTVANGVSSTGNTYGAPFEPKQNDDVNLTVIISGSKSDKRLGGHWTHLPDSVEYCVYTTVVDISSDDLDGVRHKPYLYRAWVVTTGNHPIYNFTRDDKNAIVGTNELETPYLLGEIGIQNDELGQQVIIGQDWDPTSSPVKMQNAFGAPCNGAQISVVVRAYYLPGERPSTLRGNRDGEMYAFAQSGGDDQFDLPTGVMEITSFKEIVDVTYVNPMGMVSQKPFEGLNIIVTRYSDGTTSTVKQIR